MGLHLSILIKEEKPQCVIYFQVLSNCSMKHSKVKFKSICKKTELWLGFITLTFRFELSLKKCKNAVITDALF